jgi:hypothetical protein
MSPPAIASFKIEIAGGKINCTNGGNGRFRERTVLHWDGGKEDPFTLEFFTYDSNKSVPAAPFAGFPSTVTTPFTGTLQSVAYGAEPPTYSYTISKPGGPTLDPIIVVDR